VACCFASASPADVGTRDATLWPWTSTSAINRPVGDGAVFVNDTNISALGWSFNGPTNRWTTAVALFDAANPLVHITQFSQCSQGEAFTALDLKIAIGVTGSDPQTCFRDGFLCVLSNDGYSYGFHRFVRTDNTSATGAYHALYAHDHIITGNGYPTVPGYQGKGHWISGFNLAAGIIRKWEAAGIAAGTLPYMRHTLMCSVPQTLAAAPDGSGQGSTYRWPASFSDGGYAGYAGTIKLGTLLAIPPMFDIEAQSWNEASKVLARTLQKFGCYVVSTSGGNPVIYIEGGSPATPFTQMGTYINAVRDQLRVVSNNGPSAIGGGGSYPSSLWPVPVPALP